MNPVRIHQDDFVIPYSNYFIQQVIAKVTAVSFARQDEERHGLSDEAIEDIDRGPAK